MVFVPGTGAAGACDTPNARKNDRAGNERNELLTSLNESHLAAG
jgi:hypothetical protein